MNQEQKRYAINRIQEIQSFKLGQARKKFEIPATTLTDKEKHALVASGKVKVKPYEDIKDGYYFRAWFDFSKHEQSAGVQEAPFNAASQQINTLATQAKDEIMLGEDCTEAMKLIAKLEAFKI